MLTDNGEEKTYDRDTFATVLIFINCVSFFVLFMSIVALHPKVRKCFRRRGGGPTKRSNMMRVIPQQNFTVDNSDKIDVVAEVKTSSTENEIDVVSEVKTSSIENETKSIKVRTPQQDEIKSWGSSDLSKTEVPEHLAVTSKKELQEVKKKYGPKSEEYTVALKSRIDGQYAAMYKVG